MSYAKYIEKLKLLSKVKLFKKNLSILQKEYNLPLPFGEAKKDFSIVKDWNDNLVRERRQKGLGTNVFKAIDVLFMEYKFPITFRTTFINLVFYGWPAVNEEVVIDKESPKVIIERSFRNKEPELYLRIFGDTIWKDLDFVKKNGLQEIQEGRDDFKTPIPGEKYIRMYSSKTSPKELVIFTPATSDKPAELRVRIFGNSTYRDIRAAFSEAQNYQKLLPERKNAQTFTDDQLKENMRILEIQQNTAGGKNEQNERTYDLLEELGKIGTKLVTDGVDNGERERKALNNLRQKRHLIKKRLLI